MREFNQTGDEKTEDTDEIREYGMTDLDDPEREHRIQLMTIIGEIEGHDVLPNTSKATKYEHVLPKLAEIEFYHHVVDEPKKGLAYCGVTLVPPCSLKAFIDSIADIPELCELKKLFKKALDKIVQCLLLIILVLEV